MSQTSDSNEAALVKAFLDRYLADADAGLVRSLAEYQALFPGHEALVAREYGTLVATAPAEEDAAPVGDRIAHYRILRELGHGGQGVVHLAEDERLRRRVALKVLRGVGAGLTADLARFRREAEAASRLDHPGICAVWDSGIDGSVAWIAMRYVEGQSLAKKIADRFAESATSTFVGAESERPDAATVQPAAHRTPVIRIVAIIEKAARALHAAHESGVVHRDVKPGNILVTAADDPVIVDFGLARDAGSDTPTLTRTGDQFGTPAYMSPEQVSGEAGALDRLTDVWSLGVTLFECLTGRRPFDSPHRAGLYRAILTEEPPSLRRLVPGAPRDLEIVVAMALEKDRDRRYASALDFADDLRRVRELRPIQARPISAWRRFERWSQRNPSLAAALAGLFVVLSVALLVTDRLRAVAEEQRTELAFKTRELEDALDDARAGRLGRRDREVADLIERGFQSAFSVDSRGGRASFEEALALDPGNRLALAGRFMLVGADPAAATALVERLAPELSDDPDVLWMRGMLLTTAGRKAEADRLLASAGSQESALRLFLRGHLVVRNFSPPVSEGSAHQALVCFRRAMLLATRPLWPFHHSAMMAAFHARDHVAMKEVGEALVHHWPESAATWEAIAQFYFPVDRARALEAFDRILSFGPNAGAWLGWSSHWRELGETEKELDALDRARAVDPDLAPVSFMRASALARLGRTDEAIADARRALELEPSFAPAIVPLLAGLLRRSGDPERAHRELAALADAHPGSSAVLAALGSVLLDRADRDGALVVFHRALAADPGDAAALGGLLRALADRPVEERREALRELASRAAGSRSVQLELGRLEARAGDRDLARAAFRRAVDLDPSHVAALTALRDTAESSTEAEALLTDVVVAHPDSAAAWRTLAAIRRDRRDLDGALDAARRATALEPGPASFALQREIVEHLADADRAIAEIGALCAAHPDAVAARLELGRLELVLGDPVAAARTFELAHALAPLETRVEPWLALALARVADDRDAVARLESELDLTAAEVPASATEEELRRALDRTPRDPWLRDRLARCLAIAGSAVEGLALLRRAVPWNGRHPAAHERLAAFLLDPALPAGLRDPLAAHHHARRAVELTPEERPDLQHTLARALAANGRGADALAVAEHALAVFDRRPSPRVTREALLATVAELRGRR